MPTMAMEGTLEEDTDHALWTVRRKFAAAGGPDEITLTEEGNARAFAVGAKIKRGASAEALEALWSAVGEGYLSVRGEGARMKRTVLGRFDQIAWGYLKVRGLVEAFQDEKGDGVRLTEEGKRRVWDGLEERRYLLDRCCRAARWQNKGEVA
jgi:hypothetical protein